MLTSVMSPPAEPGGSRNVSTGAPTLPHPRLRGRRGADLCDTEKLALAVRKAA